jgi:hypothetical protein
MVRIDTKTCQEVKMRLSASLCALLCLVLFPSLGIADQNAETPVVPAESGKAEEKVVKEPKKAEDGVLKLYFSNCKKSNPIDMSGEKWTWGITETEERPRYIEIGAVGSKEGRHVAVASYGLSRFFSIFEDERHNATDDHFVWQAETTGAGIWGQDQKGVPHQFLVTYEEIGKNAAEEGGHVGKFPFPRHHRKFEYRITSVFSSTPRNPEEASWVRYFALDTFDLDGNMSELSIWKMKDGSVRQRIQGNCGLMPQYPLTDPNSRTLNKEEIKALQLYIPALADGK